MEWLKQEGRILLTAPSNKVTDMFLDSIYSAILRTDLIRSNTMTLNQIIRLGKLPQKPALGVFHLERATSSFATDHGLNLKLDRDLKNAQQSVLHGAKLVVATCTSAGSQLLDQTFKHVILDDASRCTEPEALMTVLKAVQSSAQLVISGDPSVQAVSDPLFQEPGLQLSLLNRLMKLDQTTTIRLN